MPRFALTLFSILPLLAGCASAPDAPAAPPEASVRLPASALAGAVRALETLDAVRPAGTLLQVRALEGDTLLEREAGVEVVRVLLQLTVYAATSDVARAGFDELWRALEAEGRSTARVEPASAERVARVMGRLNWDPPGREDLVSYSDVIRVELAPGRTREVPTGPASAPPPFESLEAYVRSAAGEERIGQVDLSSSTTELGRGASEHRFRIEPDLKTARYTLAEIGAFLSKLEAGSPVARVTELKIERSQDEPDVRALRGWRFETELSVRGASAASTATTTASR